jgi:hypothetical protein
MFNLPFIRRTAMSVTICAVAIGVLFALPSLARPDTAQAQSCGGFSVAGGSNCSGYGGSYGSNCGLFQSSCSGGYGNYGNYGNYGSSCGSVAAQCGGYGSSGCGLFQSSCGGGYGGYGGGGYGGGSTCVGIQLTAGETCSNGVVNCQTAGGIQQGCSTGGYGPQNSAATTNQYCQPNISSSLCPGGYHAPVAANGVAGNLVGSNPVVGQNYGGGGSYSGGSSVSGTGTDALVACGSYGQVPASSCPGSSSSTTASSGTAGGATNTGLAFGSSQGLTIVYPSGWNIIAAPQGTNFGSSSGSLFTLQPGDNGYESTTIGAQLKSGAGYWLYSSGVQATLPAPQGGASATVQLPAGQWILIGDPGSTVANVSGADQVLVFDPVSGSYKQATQLQPGQGAWAMSNGGGNATITSQ